MSFPLNRVFLEALRDVDFMAVIELAQASATLDYFIFDQVLTTETLCRFLRENQYTLVHDEHNRLFTSREVTLIRRVYDKFRILGGDAFYEESLGVLDLVLARTPLERFEQSFTKPFVIPIPKLTTKLSWRFYALDEIRFHYSVRLSECLLHVPARFLKEVDPTRPVYWFHDKMSSKYLRDPDFLFCKRYIDDLHASAAVLEHRYMRRDGEEKLLDLVQHIRDSGLKNIFRKAWIQATLESALTAYNPQWQSVSADTFRKLFVVPGWMDMWSKAELGSMYAIGLTQYGAQHVEPLIAQSFDDNREALIWLFLGAHHWLLRGEESQEMRRPDIDAAGEVIGHGVCCGNMRFGLQDEFLAKRLESLSLADRLWILRKIVSQAPEFGICPDLGGTLFDYFVLGCAPEDSDVMFSALLQSMIGSRLQYLFEYAISVAISAVRNNGDARRLESLALTSARKYSEKLLRKNLELYLLLSE